MKPTSINLTARLKEKAKKEAKKRGVSLSQFVRELIDGFEVRGAKDRASDPFFQKSVYPANADRGDPHDEDPDEIDRVFAEEAGA